MVKKPTWSEIELSAFAPPEPITVSEWCDRYRILDSLSSAEAGKWKTSKTPYLKEIMNSFNEYKIEEVCLCAGSQLGKTELLLNIIAYIIAHTPAPSMLLYPIESLAEYASENRIQPMIRLIDKLYNKFKENSSEKLNLKFTDMFLTLAGANSPSKLASKPIRFVLMDEVDKYPAWSGDEANPISLATERTKTFRNRKIFKASTPTLETGNIWQAYQNTDAQKQYFIPCPQCGKFQTFKFKQIKWLDEENVRDTSYYECEHCHQAIYDEDKQAMLQQGRWQIINRRPNKKIIRSVGYHINSIYSPFVTFGQVAEQFLKSKDYPELLMNFVNSWLGEPWKSDVKETKTDEIFAKQTNYEKQIIPKEAMVLTAGIDVQKDHFYYIVRAWGKGMTSWLIDYGRCETFQEIERKIINNPYQGEDGENVYIHLVAMDSGYNSEEIYDFCKLYEGIVIPVKGSSTPLKSKYTVTTLNKGNSAGTKLYRIDTSQYKNFIFSRIRKSIEEVGSWNVFDGIEPEYADMICSEQLVDVINKRTGEVKQKWQPVSSHAANHYLDCEVYATLAADVFGVRDIYTEKQIREKEMEEQKIKEEAKPKVEQQENEYKQYVKPKKSFIKKKYDWFR